MKLPYGISNFETLITGGYYYVDKTNFLKKLDNWVSYVLLVRPRRFGKSLWISIMQYYYDIKEKDKFDKLFGKLYIGKNKTNHASSYYVLKFDFSGIDTRDADKTYDWFLDVVKDWIRQFIKRYNIDDGISILSNKTPESLLRHLITQFESQYPNDKIFTLIDEYDHFTNEVLWFDTKRFQNMVEQNWFVRKFYEVLKKWSTTVIDRIFITWVTPVTLDSLTSWFNIALYYSTEWKYNEMFGFTDEEVKKILAETKKKCPNLNIDQLYENLKIWYNGYHFWKDWEFEKKVFNSDMILWFLYKYLSEGWWKKKCTPPEDLLDINIASDYGKVWKMTKLSVNQEEILKAIISKEEISSAITTQFSVEKKFTDDDTYSLMYYLWILTMKGKLPEWWYSFQVPNYVIEKLYLEYFGTILEKRLDISIDNKVVREILKWFVSEKNPTKLIELLEEFLKKRLDNRDFRWINELSLKIIILTIMSIQNTYFVKSEFVVSQKFVDIAFLDRQISEWVKYDWYIETKQCFKEEKLRKKDIDEARDQLKEYMKTKMWYGNNELVGLLVIGYDKSKIYYEIVNCELWIIG